MGETKKMGRWCSLFLPCVKEGVNASEIIRERLRDGLTAMGYTLYDPFVGIPGNSYPRAVKLFVSVPHQHWIRVTAAPEPESMMAKIGLAKTVLSYEPFPLCLSLALDEDEHGESIALIEVYANGEKAIPSDALIPYLKPNVSADDLERVLEPTIASKRDILTRGSSSAPNNIFANLPDDIQQMSESINREQAQRLTARLSQTLLGRLGGAPVGTSELLRGSAPAWDSRAGQRITDLASCLQLPDDWRDPDFATIRDAYALYKRRERNPNATLLPGDRATIDAVPDIASYDPIYGGKPS